jgi:hypothetical protein
MNTRWMVSWRYSRLSALAVPTANTTKLVERRLPLAVVPVDNHPERPLAKENEIARLVHH